MVPQDRKSKTAHESSTKKSISSDEDITNEQLRKYAPAGKFEQMCELESINRYSKEARALRAELVAIAKREIAAEKAESQATTNDIITVIRDPNNVLGKMFSRDADGTIQKCSHVAVSFAYAVDLLLGERRMIVFGLWNCARVLICKVAWW